VGDDEEAENKALTSLRNAGPPDSARASESIGDPSGDVSLGSDGVLNVENSFARAGRGQPRGGAVEGLIEEGAEGVEEGAEGAELSSGNARPPDHARANEFIGVPTVGESLVSDGVLNAVKSFARAKHELRSGVRARGREPMRWK